MMHRIAWIAASTGLAGALSAWACTVTNEDHCGHRQGDATCQELYQTGVCSVCAVANNGCIDGPVPEGCAPEGVTAGADTSGTAPSTSAPTTSGSAAAGTATGTGDVTVGSTSNESETSTTTGGPAGVCQDGMRDPGELCDQDDLGDWTCADFGGGAGVPSCNEDCTLDTTPCGSKGGCMNGELDPGEQCDPSAKSEFGDNDCEKATGDVAPGGMLACTNECVMTTGACCLPESTQCEELLRQTDFECCPGFVCRLDLREDLLYRCRPPP